MPKEAQSKATKTKVADNIQTKGKDLKQAHQTASNEVGPTYYVVLDAWKLNMKLLESRVEITNPRRIRKTGQRVL